MKSIGGVIGLIAALLAIAFCSPAWAQAHKQKVALIYDTDAVMKICRSGLLGCATKITIDSRDYLVNPPQERMDVSRELAR